jgi:hypothetical protein
VPIAEASLAVRFIAREARRAASGCALLVARLGEEVPTLMLLEELGACVEDRSNARLELLELLDATCAELACGCRD